MERLEKLVNKHHEEHIPLIKSVHFPIAEEVIEISSDEFEEESFEEVGNPKVRRITNFLNGPWNFLENDKPYETLWRSVVVLSCLTACIIGGVQVYNYYL